MHKFIYCSNQSYVEKLKLAGFKVVHVMQINNQDCYVFENNAMLKTFQFDIGKCFFSSKLNFN